MYDWRQTQSDLQKLTLFFFHFPLFYHNLFNTLDDSEEIILLFCYALSHFTCCIGCNSRRSYTINPSTPASISLRLPLKLIWINICLFQNPFRFVDEWVSDCCLTPTQLNFSAISWREEFNIQWDDVEVRFVLDQHVYRSWIFIVLPHWNNSSWIDMLPHSDTLSWFLAKQSLFFLLNALCLEEKQ